MNKTCRRNNTLIPLFMSLLVSSTWAESSRGPTKFEQKLSEAKSYEEKGKYEKAEEAYQKVIKEYREQIMLEARLKLITFYIRSGNQAQAREAFETIDFSGRPDLVGAIYEIACQWDDVASKNGIIKNYERANKIYCDIIQKYKDKADKALNELVTLLSQHPEYHERLANTLSEMAYGYYMKAGREGFEEGGYRESFFRKSVELWVRLVKEFPNHHTVPGVYFFRGNFLGVFFGVA